MYYADLNALLQPVVGVRNRVLVSYLLSHASNLLLAYLWGVHRADRRNQIRLHRDRRLLWIVCPFGRSFPAGDLRASHLAEVATIPAKCRSREGASCTRLFWPLHK